MNRRLTSIPINEYIHDVRINRKFVLVNYTTDVVTLRLLRVDAFRRSFSRIQLAFPTLFYGPRDLLYRIGKRIYKYAYRRFAIPRLTDESHTCSLRVRRLYDRFMPWRPKRSREIQLTNGLWGSVRSNKMSACVRASPGGFRKRCSIRKPMSEMFSVRVCREFDTIHYREHLCDVTYFFDETTVLLAPVRSLLSACTDRLRLKIVFATGM